MMTKGNLLISVFMALTWLSGCSFDAKIKPKQQQLAANIYAQLALGYMESGHLTLAEQRLNKAIALMPNGQLTLRATKQWQLMQLTRP
jgi:Tfp pilus assembly protein PilF|tara:strand:- start:22238 stop:22501 length:264 start_codon:yes stop_codon:yes gene_type:complete